MRASVCVLTGYGGAAVRLGDAQEGLRAGEAVRLLEQVREARVQLARAHRGHALRGQGRARLLAVQTVLRCYALEHDHTNERD